MKARRWRPVTEWQQSRGKKYFGPEDFVFDKESKLLKCPAGNTLWLKTKNFQSVGGRYKGVSYMEHIESLPKRYQMQTVVQKWGNSLGIRIPSFYVKEFDLKNRSLVEIVEEEGKLMIKPGKLTLEQLLSQVTEENMHEAVETGPSVGKEEW